MIKPKTCKFSWSQAVLPGHLNNSVWWSLSLPVAVIHLEFSTGLLLPSVFHEMTPPADFVLLFICFMRPTVDSCVLCLSVHPLQLLLLKKKKSFQSAPLKLTAWQVPGLARLLRSAQLVKTCTTNYEVIITGRSWWLFWPWLRKYSFLSAYSPWKKKKNLWLKELLKPRYVSLTMERQ